MNMERRKLQLEADEKKGGEDDDKSTGLKRGKSMENQDNKTNPDEIQMKKSKNMDRTEPGEGGKSVENE